ncbi:carboxypeptidase-like regulatory domain-containing protein [Jejuia pallidilutea]|uniref:Carboxypeptidase-like protein n=1 Tax=Jejuia pallidilutea TaxID=504487 RepID=A0A090W319_9FLAO|nr:carboxypeptidase-like regulatory domain-containing protein [Jejuia pallidilutea]GAL66002.1 hypothetical protein JCM19301_567 [Jejuia pallidilutea]GAL70603.1 hypothetical protein JCM19302_1512 [Jejuia pallidilutea]GAL88062.1 hypothetical protein JCM19538_2425 [Jejuia pallidilutea]
MTPKHLLFLSVFLIGLSSFAQTVRGIVLDAKTQAPIETATVYFDNTTLGTITDEHGKFSIAYSNAIQSPLVISFLGYKTQLITDYRRKKSIEVFLIENPEDLGEVYISTDDEMSRRQKLKLFRRELLGTSDFGKSCTILNEDDIIIRYNKKERLLTAYSKAPLQIENKALQYLVSYDVTAFKLRLYNFSFNPFKTKSVGFYGTTFYKNLTIFNKKKAYKNRAKAYQGSRLQFMRALYANKLEERGYEIFSRKTKIYPQNYFNYFYLESKNNSDIKRLFIRQQLNVLYKRWEQSSIELLVPSIFIDYFGNYTNVDKVRFTGAMGEQRVGELLPFDYGL